jgi:signal peptidase
MLLAVLPTMLNLDRHVIESESMAGSIDRGSVVFEQVVPVSDLRVGDVVSYPAPEGYGTQGLVTHRIVEVSNGFVRTQGDANATADPWLVPMSEPTQERVVLTVPYIGYPFIVPLGSGFWTLTLIAPFLLLGLPRTAESIRRRHARHEATALWGDS